MIQNPPCEAPPPTNMKLEKTVNIIAAVPITTPQNMYGRRSRRLGRPCSTGLPVSSFAPDSVTLLFAFGLLIIFHHYCVG